jgi:hypothetical protein
MIDDDARARRKTPIFVTRDTRTNARERERSEKEKRKKKKEKRKKNRAKNVI